MKRAIPVSAIIAGTASRKSIKAYENMRPLNEYDENDLVESRSTKKPLNQRQRRKLIRQTPQQLNSKKYR